MAANVKKNNNGQYTGFFIPLTAADIEEIYRIADR